MDTCPAVNTSTATLTRAERRRQHREQRAARAQLNPTPGYNRSQRRETFGPRPTDLALAVRRPSRPRPLPYGRTTVLPYLHGGPIPTSGQARINAKRLRSIAFWSNAVLSWDALWDSRSATAA